MPTSSSHAETPPPLGQLPPPGSNTSRTHSSLGYFSSPPPATTHGNGRPTAHAADLSSETTTTMTSPAVTMARRAPQAGYLLQTTTSSPQGQRRFCVLQPSTHLYYFHSAHDVTPCGCLDLDGARIVHDLSPTTTSSAAAGDDPRPAQNDETWGEENRSTHRRGNGTGGNIYRFAIVWDDPDNNNNIPPSSKHHSHYLCQGKKVVLEARSKEDAWQWIQALEQERLPYVKNEWHKALRKNSAYACRVSELEQQLADLKLVEQDRDGALQDAAQCRTQFQQLDESLRQLTQQLLVNRRRKRTNSPHKSDTSFNQPPKHSTSPSPSAHDDIANDETGITVANTDADGQDEPEGSPGTIDANENDDESGVTTTMDLGQVPGTHFSALYNAVEQLGENWRLASEEAESAVEDVTAANERVAALELRMAHAEKLLTQYWEDNCTLRKALKRKKRERQVLVREFKNLRETATAAKTKVNNKKTSSFTDEFLDASDEEKLISELEEHVISSIRLHDEFLAANGGETISIRGQDDGLVDVDLSLEDDSAIRYLVDSAVKLAASDKKSPPSIHPNVPLFERPTLPVASLFDDDDDEEEPSNSEASGREGLGAALPSEPNIAAADREIVPRHLLLEKSMDESRERPNPLIQLDTDEEEGGEQLPQLCAASSQSESSTKSSRVPDHATSKLSCPLADVVTTGSAPPTIKDDDDDLRVYHLTFYSRRMGLQFQKVPPPPVKAKGLLTEAMTTDLVVSSPVAGSTAAELRRIASISTRSKSSSRNCNKDENEITCELATPVDAVLVCGFQGFDESSANVRPKLGARLVAFDGVSIEVGKWTFDAVRMAIQARDRPLTLSFRNDFLTTEQRTILTKAVRDMNSSPLPPRRTSHHKERGAIMTVRPTTDPSVQSSSLSQEGRSSACSHYHVYDDLSTESDHLRYWSFPESFSGPRSVSSVNNNRYEANFRSFSEAGSSTASGVLSAVVAPLVSNLLLNYRRKGTSGKPYTPEYLKRAHEAVEETPQHQDFASELL